MTHTNNSFQVHKTEINKTQLVETQTTEITQGEVLLKIDQYAFTSNNITYAVTGHKLGYWKFFPATEPFGIVPVWGYADVVESKDESVPVGERFYGYFPMSTYLKVQVSKPSPYGFFDASEHRAALPSLYNYYMNIKADISYDADKENYAPIIRPLFTTSFLNYHFLKDADFFAAEQIIITSASSKTAMGLAFLLKKNQAADGKKIVGLTSARNVEFVKNTNYYDEVLTYEALETALPKKDSTVVDMAGNSTLLQRLTDHLGEQLKFISLIGLTDWTSGKEFKQIPNSKFFFAPSVAQEKYKAWGVAETNQKIAVEFADFTANAAAWMELVFIKDNNSLTDLYQDMLKGKVDPKKGYIVKM